MHYFKITLCDELKFFMNKNYPHLKDHEIDYIFMNSKIEKLYDDVFIAEKEIPFHLVPKYIKVNQSVAIDLLIDSELPLITDKEGTAWISEEFKSNQQLLT